MGDDAEVTDVSSIVNQSVRILSPSGVESREGQQSSIPAGSARLAVAACGVVRYNSGVRSPTMSGVLSVFMSNLSARRRGSSLANNKSAEKRARVAERRRVRNRTYRSASRTMVRRAEELIRAAEKEAASGAVLNAQAMLDRAASKGVIHPNNAARRKSRLMAKYNSMATS